MFFKNIINGDIMSKINVIVDDKVKEQAKETIKAIENAEKGIVLSKEYSNLNEMWKDLEKEN